MIRLDHVGNSDSDLMFFIMSEYWDAIEEYGTEFIFDWYITGP